MDKELLKSYKAARKKKKERNIKTSTKILDEKSISYEFKTPYHVMITNNEHLIDFWPTTGKWYHRFNERYGRGVFNLVEYLGVE